MKNRLLPHTPELVLIRRAELKEEPAELFSAQGIEWKVAAGDTASIIG